MKARLEEAKLQDLQPGPENVRRITERRAPQGRPQLQGSNVDNRDRRCFVCGQGGHLKRQCDEENQLKLKEQPEGLQVTGKLRTT